MRKSLPGIVVRACALALLFAAPPAYGQSGRLRFDDLRSLEEKASQVTNVTMDSPMIRLISQTLTDRTPEESRLKQVALGLKGIYVKVYEFDDGRGYAESDLDLLREQLRAPGWSKLVGIYSRRDRSNTDVYVLADGGQVGGIAVVLSEPDQLTLVNVVGPLGLDNLNGLEGRFGVPPLELVRREPSAAEPFTRKRVVTRP